MVTVNTVYKEKTQMYQCDYVFAYMGNNEDPCKSQFILKGEGKEEDMAYQLGLAISYILSEKMAKTTEDTEKVIEMFLKGFADFLN